MNIEATERWFFCGWNLAFAMLPHFFRNLIQSALTF